MDETDGDKNRSINPFILYGSILQGLMGAADNLAGTFAMLYAVARGSVGLIQGVLVSIRELGSSLLQPIWGYLSDRYGRKLFVFIGFAIQSLSWGVLIPLADTPLKILGIFIFQTTLGTMLFPCWAAWIGDNSESRNRGKIIGFLGLVGSWSGLLALIVVSSVMEKRDPSRVDIGTYSYAFRIAGVLYASAAVITLLIPDKRGAVLEIERKGKVPTLTRIKDLIRSYKPEFRRLLFVEGVFRVSWSFAWPLFPYAILSATNNWSQLAYLSVVMGITSGLSMFYGGRLSDRIGRNKVIIWSRVVLVIPPILYGVGAIYDEPIYLFISNALVGLIVGAGGVSVNSMILDIAPVEKQATYFSTYLMVMGILAFCGSMLMGGILYFVARDEAPSSETLMLLFIIVACFRFLAWFGYFRLPALATPTR
ncbi:MAG: MFS transporter [Candidatus Kariarchaeaceae archaeon]|jgi:MFS family permease